MIGNIIGEPIEGDASNTNGGKSVMMMLWSMVSNAVTCQGGRVWSNCYCLDQRVSQR